ALSTSATCSPRQLKSAARIDGATWTMMGSPVSLAGSREVASGRLSRHVRDVDVIAAAAVGDEGEAPAVGGPRGVVVPGGVVGGGAVPRPVRVHQVDFVVAVAVAGEGEPLAVGRPDGPVVHLRVAREAADVAPVGVHRVDLEVARPAAAEGEALGVGRPA